MKTLKNEKRSQNSAPIQAIKFSDLDHTVMDPGFKKPACINISLVSMCILVAPILELSVVNQKGSRLKFRNRLTDQ